MSQPPPTPDPFPGDHPGEVTGRTFNVVDVSGRVRAAWSVEGDAPTLTFFDRDSKPRLQLVVNDAGFPQVLLYGQAGKPPTLKAECDANGGHVWLAGEGKQESYLFLKNTGATGVVLINAQGVRQAELMISAEGEPRCTLRDISGKNLNESPSAVSP